MTAWPTPPQPMDSSRDMPHLPSAHRSPKGRRAEVAALSHRASLARVRTSGSRVAARHPGRQQSRHSGFSTIGAVLIVAIAALLPTTTSGGTTSPAALRLLTEPSAGIAPIDALCSGAKHSIDLVVYELADPHLEAILAADAARGVTVRVLLDRDDEESHNAAAYAYLQAHHVAVRWASNSGIELTHEKAAVIDGKTALVMTLNLVAEDYASTRDFAIVDTQPRDVAAIDAVFTADWRGDTITPPSDPDLVWSPGAEAALVSVINGAHHSLLVENEEMADPYITAPLEAAAHRDVRVEVVMTASSSWGSAFDALAKAGVAIRTYAESAPLYIHAKAIVADAGTNNARAFLGSQNFSITSLVHNRELGIVTGSPAIVSGVASVIAGDFSEAGPWRG